MTSQKKWKKKYGTTGVIAQNMLKNGVLKGQDSIKFFRGFKSVQDIRDMSSEGFEKFVDLHHLHISDGCSDSCEPFHGENQDSRDQERKIIFI